jgi:hypothetical protein
MKNLHFPVDISEHRNRNAHVKRIQPVFLVICIALWVPCLMIFLAIGGCAPGRPGLLGPMSAPVEHGITNTVQTVIQAAPAYVPQPYATAIEAGGAAVLALLAAWQGLTHSKVKVLETNNPVQNKPPTI